MQHRHSSNINSASFANQTQLEGKLYPIIRLWLFHFNVWSIYLRQFRYLFSLFFGFIPASVIFSLWFVFLECFYLTADCCRTYRVIRKSNNRAAIVSINHRDYSLNFTTSKYWMKHVTYVMSFHLWVVLIIPILQRWKIRLREVRKVAQEKCQNKALNPEFSYSMWERQCIRNYIIFIHF